MVRYSQAFKEALIKKVLQDPRRSIRSVADEAQVGIASVYEWIKAARGVQGGKDNLTVQTTNHCPQSWSPAQKLQAVIESHAFNEEELMHYCRQQGLYRSQLEQWKQELMSNKEPSQSLKGLMQELKLLRSQNKQLQQELNRKEKALAEASALLLLKKKASLIWPATEDD